MLAVEQLSVQVSFVRPEDVQVQFCLLSAGSVDLSYSDVLYRDLSKGLDGLLLNSCLHLVYLVTPYDMISQCKPDWMTYFRQVCGHVTRSDVTFPASAHRS